MSDFGTPSPEAQECERLENQIILSIKGIMFCLFVALVGGASLLASM